MDANPHVLPAAFGRYRPRSIIGAGAMGVVYRAYDPLIDRSVAIKVMRTDAIEPEMRAELLQRFLQEARAAAGCSHPALVAVHDFGGDPQDSSGENPPFIVMDLVEGCSLAVLLRDPRLRAELSLSAVLLPVLEALSMVHGLGIVHRDIKPANILITPTGHPKLTDFGIARLNQGAQCTTLTQAGMLIGTPNYMAPEQAQGGPIDHRADLFSMGCILYEMLTGQSPFGGDSIAETLLRLASPEPAPMDPVSRAAPRYIGVLERALAKPVALRFVSAQDFAAALRGLDDLTLLRTLCASPASPLFDAEFLVALSRDLAVHLGPIATTLVRRAAAYAPDRNALCRRLAEHLEQPEQRSAFLHRNSIEDRPVASDQTARPSSGPALSAEAIAAAQAVLAAEVGPIATLIVRKAAATTQSESGFLDDLAAQTPIAATLRAKLQSAMRTRHDSA
jgi:serine/threonine-protein kinase